MEGIPRSQVGGPTGKSKSSPTPGAPPRHPLVMVADDDADLLDLLRQVLEEEGFLVQAHMDSESAAQALAAGLPDLLIADAHLHGDQPLGLLQWLVDNVAALPAIIVLTGASERIQATRGDLLQRAGAHVEPKPFELEHLLDLARTLTGHL
jgi:CheY-like chemotaxis protein